MTSSANSTRFSVLPLLAHQKLSVSILMWSVPKLQTLVLVRLSLESFSTILRPISVSCSSMEVAKATTTDLTLDQIAFLHAVSFFFFLAKFFGVIGYTCAHAMTAKKCTTFAIYMAAITVTLLIF